MTTEDIERVMKREKVSPALAFICAIWVGYLVWSAFTK